MATHHWEMRSCLHACLTLSDNMYASVQAFAYEHLANPKSPFDAMEYKQEKKFLRWLAGENVKCSSCSVVSQTPSSGCRGVVATESILCGDVVVAVPDAAVLMVDNGVIAEVLASQICVLWS